LRYKLLIATFLSCSFSFAQPEEKEQSLPEVKHASQFIRVKYLHDLMPSLTRKEIIELQSDDAGQLLQRFPGIHVRSYGGLGGLKTISVRGLGGQHSQLVIDGFTSTQDQTGQINLGTIQTDNIEEVVLKNYQLNLAPASAMSAGNVIIMNTFENRFSNKKNEFRFAQRLGSFGQTDTYLAYKKGDSLMRYFVAAYGKFRQSHGLYPFTVMNGNQPQEGVRINNFYRDLNAGISAGWNVRKKGYLIANYRRTVIDQELPGPVVLYYDHADETLAQDNQVLQLKFNSNHRKGFDFLGFASARIGTMHYHDPSYFNLGLERSSDYLNQGFVLGANVAYSGFQHVRLYLASEQQMSRLESDEIQGTPHRQHHFSVLGATWARKNFKTVTQLAYQSIYEHNTASKGTWKQRANPFIELTYQHAKRIELRSGIAYRSSFRMPSFNELYYNNIGNTQLNPERAEQFSLFSDLVIEKTRVDWTIRPTIYFNQVIDKIVAIPSQNLFIWSMQNVGLVHVKGFDFQCLASFELNKNNKLNLSSNYTFQYATDQTDPNSPTYGHQLAYVPLHNGNIDLSYHYKKHGLRLGVFANSLRYSLNENTPSNIVKAYALLDAAIFTRFDYKTHQFRLQFSVKNALNSSYAVIRNYVMPGRNFLITLNYEIGK
jgi:vitamin B12 transporter